MDDQLSKMEPDREAALRAISGLVEWCLAHEAVLAQGRSFGLRIGVSPAVKDAIAMAAPAETAARINANLLSLPA